MELRTVLAALAIGLSLACVAGFASAQQVYKWKDANGVTHFSQTPPTNGAKYSKMHLDNAPAVSSNPSAEGDANARGESDSGSAPDAPAASGTKDEQPDTAANRAKLCRQLASNISLLESKQPVVTTGGDGKQQVMGDEAREQQLATAKAQQAQYCRAQ